MASRETARQQLIAAGIYLFAHQGYAATTTRQIATRANANIGLIAYHFGGKAQLQTACAQAVADRLGGVSAAVASDAVAEPDQALGLMEMAVTAIIEFLVADPESETYAAFILRQMSDQTEVVDLLYDQVIEPRHRAFCQLWGLACGQDPESEQVRLAVFSLLGQVIYFRLGRPVVERRMSWPQMGKAEAVKITETVIFNMRASIERTRP